TFPGARGANLAARLDLPEGTPAAYALFAHCFTCSKDILAASRISAALVERGIAVLRFDFTGLGSSEGEFASTDFSSNVDDVAAAADVLRDRFVAPKILVGHSLGGTAVLAAAGRVPDAVAVATVNAPYDPAHVRHLLADAVPEIEAVGEAEVVVAGRAFRIRKQFLDDIGEQNMRRAVAGLGKALIVFHAPRDRTVSVDNARLIFEAARHPKSFVSLDDADHLLTRKADAAYVGAVLAAWAGRYIDSEGATADASSPRPEPEAVPGAVVVAETGEGRFAQTIAADGHVLRADEPAAYGGTDTGPSPYDLVLAGLGACTSITVRMYADQKKWPLERVEVRLRHDRIHAEDCETCETREGKIDRIERELELTGPLQPEQRERLLEIAEKCPVHRTLESEKLIVTRLAE
ncbi:MAG: alpha/beta fold hydrolase, partial [Alphaproteobacteria bacterium]